MYWQFIYMYVHKYVIITRRKCITVFTDLSHISLGDLLDLRASRLLREHHVVAAEARPAQLGAQQRQVGGAGAEESGARYEIQP